MADLVVLGFPTKEEAEEVMEVAKKLERDDLLDLENAAIVYRRQDGKIKVEHSISTTASGAAAGALWGTLFGLLFLMPVFGLAVGAASGAVAGRLHDVGIDHRFTEDVADHLKPGTAAVFALVKHASPDDVRAALAPYRPKVIHTSLSSDREDELVTALSSGRSDPSGQSLP